MSKPTKPTHWVVKNQRGLYLEKAVSDSQSQLFTVASNFHEKPILYTTKVLAKAIAKMLTAASTRGDVWTVEAAQ